MYRAKGAAEASFSPTKHQQLHECVIGTNVKLVGLNRWSYHPQLALEPIACLIRTH